MNVRTHVPVFTSAKVGGRGDKRDLGRHFKGAKKDVWDTPFVPRLRARGTTKSLPRTLRYVPHMYSETTSLNTSAPPRFSSENRRGGYLRIEKRQKDQIGNSRSSEKRLSKTDLMTISWTMRQVSPCRACTPGSSANTRRSGLFK